MRLKSALVGFSLLLAGCADSPFWNQCVKLNAYGFTMATAYGPFNLGYAYYERNVACGADAPQVKP